MKDSRYGILCGSIGPENILGKVLSGIDVIVDVLENQVLKALHKDGGECHKALIIITRQVIMITLGTVMMVAVLRQEGRVSCESKML